MPLAMPKPQMLLSLRYTSVVSLFGLLFALNSCRHCLRNNQNMLSQTLPEYLALQLKQKHLRRADVVRGSHLDRTYVYQIFSGKKVPSRDKLLAIAFGLQLSVEETQKMLKLSGNLELYVRDKRDAAILFAIQHGRSIDEANDLLAQLGVLPLGVPDE